MKIISLKFVILVVFVPLQQTKFFGVES